MTLDLDAGPVAPAKARKVKVAVDPQVRLARAVEGLVEEVRLLRGELAQVAQDAAVARARVDALSLQVRVFTEQGGALLLRPVGGEP